MIDILSGINHREAKHCLDNFHEPELSKFAVVKISGECIENSLDVIASGLSKLYDLDLYPIVVFGWGKMLTKKLNLQGIESHFIEGNRVTTKGVLDNIGILVEEIKNDFISLSNEYGFDIADLTQEKLFSVKPMSPELGFVGEITSVNSDLLSNACLGSKIPLVAPVGYFKGDFYNINADDAARFIVQDINPLRYVVLTQTGGVLDKDLNIISKISIVDDFDYLINNGIISGGMKKKVTEAKKLLKKTKNGYGIQITSPDNLIKELFTFEGCGTKIVYGYNVDTHYSFSGLELSSISSLISQSSGKNLVEGYFDGANPEMIFLEEDYDGIVILEDYKKFCYIDKFFVRPESQSNGLGSKLFAKTVGYYEESGKSGLFWRTSKDNPANAWYHKKIIDNDGWCKSTGEWVVYGIGNEENTEKLVNYACSKRKTIK